MNGAFAAYTPGHCECVMRRAHCVAKGSQQRWIASFRNLHNCRWTTMPMFCWNLDKREVICSMYSTFDLWPIAAMLNLYEFLIKFTYFCLELLLLIIFLQYIKWYLVCLFTLRWGRGAIWVCSIWCHQNAISRHTRTCLTAINVCILIKNNVVIIMMIVIILMLILEL